MYCDQHHRINNAKFIITHELRNESYHTAFCIGIFNVAYAKNLGLGLLKKKTNSFMKFKLFTRCKQTSRNKFGSGNKYANFILSSTI